MRWILTVAIAVAACGHNNGLPPSADYAAKCATPRSGTDPATGQAYPDRPGSVNDEKTWLRSWTDELYLWYREVPTNLDPANYATPVDYFNVLRTPLTTASGAPKDKFHFIYDTAAWEALSQSGVSAGYGVQWALIARAPPRKVVAAFTEPGSPAATASILRGAQVLTVDGTDVTSGPPGPLNAGLFPATAGEMHTLSIMDVGASTARTVSLTSVAITETPVQHVGTPASGVGYILFNSHIATAEKELIAAFNQLKGVTDLVLDVRYNGGGYLYMASEVAYMIAGPGPTNSKVFEQIKWNDKYPDRDPVANQPLTPTPFISQTVGFTSDVTAGHALPHLDLPRVFILSGPGTCSASESIINSLRGVDVQVILVGSTTCGKPYGFYPQDNCGTTYFSIEFQGVNAKGFGDYSDGFVPGGTAGAAVPGCQVADDFSHALGDPAEGRLAAALQYRANGTCPPASFAMFRGEATAASDGVLVRSPWRENRIYRR
jgi:carboxyl-terminal processing protease